MSEPDLFVVCKNCSSEVSPYVTECPYCGQRVRKRAPKIEKNGGPEGAARRADQPPALPRLRRGEMPGIAPDTRPYATFVLIGAALLLTVVLSTGVIALTDVALLGPPGEQWWRVLTTLFVHPGLGYAFIALVAVAIFGSHLERRFGPVVVVVLFVVCGAAGAIVSVVLGLPALGANGAALGLLCAWLVEDRRAYRRGDDRENDLIGVYVIFGVLALVFVADPFASAAAGGVGALLGLVAGLGLAARHR